MGPLKVKTVTTHTHAPDEWREGGASRQPSLAPFTKMEAGQVTVDIEALDESHQKGNYITDKQVAEGSITKKYLVKGKQKKLLPKERVGKSLAEVVHLQRRTSSPSS